jgi:hypothetical protein
MRERSRETEGGGGARPEVPESGSYATSVEQWSRIVPYKVCDGSHTQRLLRALAGHIGHPGPEHYDFDPKNGGIVEKLTLRDFQIRGPSPNPPPNLALISDRLISYEPSFGDVS